MGGDERQQDTIWVGPLGDAEDLGFAPEDTGSHWWALSRGGTLSDPSSCCVQGGSRETPDGPRSGKVAWIRGEGAEVLRSRICVEDGISVIELL